LSDSKLQAGALTNLVSSNFRLARGVHVTDPRGIHQAYDLVEARKDYWVFTINISAENIGRSFISLARQVRKPGHFILEIGTRRDDQAVPRINPDDPCYSEVHYLDGISPRRVSSIYSRYESLLAHDGRTNFGFGSHHGVDEVYVGPYKIFRIFTNTPKKYVAALNRLKVPREEKIRTVWKTFTVRTPGRRDILADTPAILESMLARLRAAGLYFAERRKDLP